MATSASFWRCSLAFSANWLRLMAISVGSVLWFTTGSSCRPSRYSNTSQNSRTDWWSAFSDSWRSRAMDCRACWVAATCCSLSGATSRRQSIRASICAWFLMIRSTRISLMVRRLASCAFTRSRKRSSTARSALVAISRKWLTSIAPRWLRLSAAARLAAVTSGRSKCSLTMRVMIASEATTPLFWLITRAARNGGS
ncbi:hypothetical protein D3C80_1307830 [compost metagenome]